MKMRRLLIAGIIAIFISGSADSALGFDTMRCKSRLVSVGDTKYTVLLTCGEPLLKEVVGEKTIGRKELKLRDEDEVGIEIRELTVTIEKWVYQRSRYHFPRILTFEGDTLVKIDIGDKP